MTNYANIAAPKPHCRDCGKATYMLYRTTVRGGTRSLTVAGHTDRKAGYCRDCGEARVAALRDKDHDRIRKSVQATEGAR